MIGLVDLQLQSWDKPQLCPPNLEIMKLATYYKQEENKFCRLINLDETEFGGYEKIYIFSESKEFVKVPDALKRAPNVIYGGTAFTNGKYIPFENRTKKGEAIYLVIALIIFFIFFTQFTTVPFVKLMGFVD